MRGKYRCIRVGEYPLAFQFRLSNAPGAAGSPRHRASGATGACLARALLVLLAVASPAPAQVFKCTFPDGTVSYSDQRCRGASSVTEVSLPPPAPSAPAGRDMAGERERRDDAGAEDRDRPLPLVCERALDDLDRVRRGGLGSPAETRGAVERVVEMCSIILDAPRDQRRQAGRADGRDAREGRDVRDARVDGPAAPPGAPARR